MYRKKYLLVYPRYNFLPFFWREHTDRQMIHTYAHVQLYFLKIYFLYLKTVAVETLGTEVKYQGFNTNATCNLHKLQK